MSQLSPTISINKVTPSQYKNFSCGEVKLDEYISRFAKKHEKQDFGRTFVLCNDTNQVVGYYTLSAAQLSIDDLPLERRNKLPRYPVPASRLCRLAVDLAFQGQGIEDYLLGDAIRRVLIANESTAIHCLIVDAKNEKAKKFYLKYGFEPLDCASLSLFIPISTLQEE